MNNSNKICQICCGVLFTVLYPEVLYSDLFPCFLYDGALSAIKAKCVHNHIFIIYTPYPFKRRYDRSCIGIAVSPSEFYLDNVFLCNQTWYSVTSFRVEVSREKIGFLFFESWLYGFVPYLLNCSLLQRKLL